MLWLYLFSQTVTDGGQPDYDQTNDELQNLEGMAEDVTEAQGGGTTEVTGNVEQEGPTKSLFLAPSCVNILTQSLHFSTFHPVKEKQKTSK